MTTENFIHLVGVWLVRGTALALGVLVGKVIIGVVKASLDDWRKMMALVLWALSFAFSALLVHYGSKTNDNGIAALIAFFWGVGFMLYRLDLESD